MLIELHLIQNHAPSNLNRDDTGSPKDAIFGGHPRARISSQCLKRSIRRSEVFQDALAGRLAERTRKLADRVEAALPAPLRDDPDAVAAIRLKVSAIGSDKEDPKKQETRQTIFCADDEVRAIAATAAGLYEELGAKDFAKLKGEELAAKLGSHHPRSADVALFGRMTTSAAFEDVEAALQVAHALGTTRLQREFDYFTAVDDLQGPGDDAGADMIGDVEFNSATYYKYFSLHWGDLLRNLGGARQVATDAAAALVEAACLAIPSGKQNSFAAHNLPDAVLLEIRDRNVPLSYANAFVKPITPRGDADVVAGSIAALIEYRAALLPKFGLAPRRGWWLTTRGQDAPGLTASASLPELLDELRAELAAEAAG